MRCGRLHKARESSDVRDDQNVTYSEGRLKKGVGLYVQVPAGTAMLMSVSTRALPRAGMVVSLEAYTSYPAAKALPRVGRRALSESFLTRSGGDWFSAMAALSVLARLAGGDVGGDVMPSAVVMIYSLCWGAGRGEGTCSIDLHDGRKRGGVRGAAFVFCR